MTRQDIVPGQRPFGNPADYLKHTHHTDATDVHGFGGPGSAAEKVTRPSFVPDRFLPKNGEPSKTVLSLLVIDNATTKDGQIIPDTMVLVGVRDPRTNITHPNVISTPTYRVIPAVLEAAFGGYEPGSTTLSQEGDLERFNVHWQNAHPDENAHAARRYLAESLLRAKLGVEIRDEAMTLRSVEPQVSVFGKVPAGNPDNLKEPEYTHMAGFAAMVDFMRNPFPSDTEAYSNLTFIRIEDLANMVDTKDPMLIDIVGGKGSFIELCVKGLCVRTARELYHHQVRRGVPAEA